MRVIRNSNYNKHDVHWKYSLGPESYQTNDTPRRVDVIMAMLKSDPKFVIEESREFPADELKRLHPYHDFIKKVSESVKDESEEIYPDLFPGEGAKLKRKVHHLWGGVWCTDAVTPISQHTYMVAKGSAEVAMTAAELVANGDEREIYALCRPSGHHAGPRVFGGYCYFNNVVLAAEKLLKKGKVAILDIDYHHGNGTQEFCEERGDIFTCSIHCDPDVEYPYFWGYEDERGHGEGEGSNLNLPLPQGTSTESYLHTLDTALQAIADFGTEYLVIGAGFDTHANDPIGGFRIPTEGYAPIGQRLGELGLPTVICQEGGYNTEVLGPSVHNFLDGFLAGRE